MRHDFLREPDPVGQRTAPLVSAVVGPPGQELVDQVALRPHDLHPVISGLPGEQGAAHVILNGSLHAPPTQNPRAELADGRLAFGRGHAERVVAITSAVENLQGNPPARGMDRFGDRPVLAT